MSVNRVNSSDGSLSPIATRGQYIQYVIMPTASADILGKVVQYIGADTYDYKNGCFYRCITDGTNYVWENINTQSMDKYATTFIGTEAEWDALNAEQKSYYTIVNLTDAGYTVEDMRYSTSEIITGKTWIDGKPIYRKVLTGTFSNGTEVSIASLNIQTIVNANGHTTFTNGYSSPFPYCTGSSGGVLADFRITPLNNSPKILFDLDTGWSNNTYIIILEYTKTTD